MYMVEHLFRFGSASDVLCCWLSCLRKPLSLLANSHFCSASFPFITFIFFGLQGLGHKREVLSCTVTTPACHLTLPLVSISFHYFSRALHSPPAPFHLFSINFCFLLPASASVPIFFPRFRHLLHCFRFGTCFPWFSTLPTSLLSLLLTSARFLIIRVVRRNLSWWVNSYW